MRKKCRKYRRGDYSLFFDRIAEGTLRVDCTAGTVEILCPQSKEWREPHIDVNEHGYLFFRVYKDGFRRKVAVHRLVWMVHNGRQDVPAGHEVHHEDLNQRNNSGTNLKLLDCDSHRELHNAIVPF